MCAAFLLEQREIDVRRSVVRHIALELYPFLTCPCVISEFGQDRRSHIACVRVTRSKIHRPRHLVQSIGESPRPLVSEAEVEMRFAVSGAERGGLFQRIDRFSEISLLKVGKTQIEKEVPLFEPEPRRLQILVKLVRSASGHVICETQMIMGERIPWFGFQKLAMEEDSLRVVFATESIIRSRIADLFGSWIAYRGDANRTDYRRQNYRGNQPDQRSYGACADHEHGLRGSDSRPSQVNVLASSVKRSHGVASQVSVVAWPKERTRRATLVALSVSGASNMSR